jgi:hypothetical protein
MSIDRGKDFCLTHCPYTFKSQSYMILLAPEQLKQYLCLYMRHAFETWYRVYGSMQLPEARRSLLDIIVMFLLLMIFRVCSTVPTFSKNVMKISKG